MNSEAGQNNNQISSNQPVIETLDLNPTQQPVASTVQTQPAASDIRKAATSATSSGI